MKSARRSIPTLELGWTESEDNILGGRNGIFSEDAEEEGIFQPPSSLLQHHLHVKERLEPEREVVSVNVKHSNVVSTTAREEKSPTSYSESAPFATIMKDTDILDKKLSEILRKHAIDKRQSDTPTREQTSAGEASPVREQPPSPGAPSRYAESKKHAKEPDTFVYSPRSKPKECIIGSKGDEEATTAERSEKSVVVKTVSPPLGSGNTPLPGKSVPSRQIGLKSQMNSIAEYAKVNEEAKSIEEAMTPVERSKPTKLSVVTKASCASPTLSASAMISPSTAIRDSPRSKQKSITSSKKSVLSNKDKSQSVKPGSIVQKNDKSSTTISRKSKSTQSGHSIQKNEISSTIKSRVGALLDEGKAVETKSQPAKTEYSSNRSTSTPEKSEAFVKPAEDIAFKNLEESLTAKIEATVKGLAAPKTVPSSPRYAGPSMSVLTAPSGFETFTGFPGAEPSLVCPPRRLNRGGAAKTTFKDPLHDAKKEPIPIVSVINMPGSTKSPTDGTSIAKSIAESEKDPIFADDEHLDEKSAAATSVTSAVSAREKLASGSVKSGGLASVKEDDEPQPQEVHTGANEIPQKNDEPDMGTGLLSPIGEGAAWSPHVTAPKTKRSGRLSPRRFLTRFGKAKTKNGFKKRDEVVECVEEKVAVTPMNARTLELATAELDAKLAEIESAYPQTKEETAQGTDIEQLQCQKGDIKESKSQAMVLDSEQLQCEGDVEESKSEVLILDNEQLRCQKGYVSDSKNEVLVVPSDTEFSTVEKESEKSFTTESILVELKDSETSAVSTKDEVITHEDLHESNSFRKKSPKELFFDQPAFDESEVVETSAKSTDVFSRLSPSRAFRNFFFGSDNPTPKSPRRSRASDGVHEFEVPGAKRVASPHAAVPSEYLRVDGTNMKNHSDSLRHDDASSDHVQILENKVYSAEYIESATTSRDMVSHESLADNFPDDLPEDLAGALQLLSDSRPNNLPEKLLSSPPHSDADGTNELLCSWRESDEKANITESPSRIKRGFKFMSGVKKLTKSKKERKSFGSTPDSHRTHLQNVPQALENLCGEGKVTMEENINFLLNSEHSAHENTTVDENNSKILDEAEKDTSAAMEKSAAETSVMVAPHASNEPKSIAVTSHKARKKFFRRRPRKLKEHLEAATDGHEFMGTNTPGENPEFQSNIDDGKMKNEDVQAVIIEEKYHLPVAPRSPAISSLASPKFEIADHPSSDRIELNEKPRIRSPIHGIKSFFSKQKRPPGAEEDTDIDVALKVENPLQNQKNVEAGATSPSAASLASPQYAIVDHPSLDQVELLEKPQRRSPKKSFMSFFGGHSRTPKINADAAYTTSKIAGTHLTGAREASDSAIVLNTDVGAEMKEQDMGGVRESSFVCLSPKRALKSFLCSPKQKEVVENDQRSSTAMDKLNVQFHNGGDVENEQDMQNYQSSPVSPLKHAFFGSPSRQKVHEAEVTTLKEIEEMAEKHTEFEKIERPDNISNDQHLDGAAQLGNMNYVPSASSLASPKFAIDDHPSSDVVELVEKTQPIGSPKHPFKSFFSSPRKKDKAAVTVHAPQEPPVEATNKQEGALVQTVESSVACPSSPQYMVVNDLEAAQIEIATKPKSLYSSQKKQAKGFFYSPGRRETVKGKLKVKSEIGKAPAMLTPFLPSAIDTPAPLVPGENVAVVEQEVENRKAHHQVIEEAAVQSPTTMETATKAKRKKFFLKSTKRQSRKTEKTGPIILVDHRNCHKVEIVGKLIDSPMFEPATHHEAQTTCTPKTNLTTATACPPKSPAGIEMTASGHQNMPIGGTDGTPRDCESVAANGTLLQQSSPKSSNGIEMTASGHKHAIPSNEVGKSACSPKSPAGIEMTASGHQNMPISGTDGTPRACETVAANGALLKQASPKSLNGIEMTASGHKHTLPSDEIDEVDKSASSVSNTLSPKSKLCMNEARMQLPAPTNESTDERTNGDAITDCDDTKESDEGSETELEHYDGKDAPASSTVDIHTNTRESEKTIQPSLFTSIFFNPFKLATRIEEEDESGSLDTFESKQSAFQNSTTNTDEDTEDEAPLNEGLHDHAFSQESKHKAGATRSNAANGDMADELACDPSSAEGTMPSLNLDLQLELPSLKQQTFETREGFRLHPSGTDPSMMPRLPPSSNPQSSLVQSKTTMKTKGVQVHTSETEQSTMQPPPPPPPQSHGHPKSTVSHSRSAVSSRMHLPSVIQARKKNGFGKRLLRMPKRNQNDREARRSRIAMIINDETVGSSIASPMASPTTGGSLKPSSSLNGKEFGQQHMRVFAVSDESLDSEDDTEVESIPAIQPIASACSSTKQQLVPSPKSDSSGKQQSVASVKEPATSQNSRETSTKGSGSDDKGKKTKLSEGMRFAGRPPKPRRPKHEGYERLDRKPPRPARRDTTAPATGALVRKGGKRNHALQKKIQKNVSLDASVASLDNSYDDGLSGVFSPDREWKWLW